MTNEGAAGEEAKIDPKVEAKAEAFDDILDRLRKLVDRLESGNLSLEDGLRCFEQGMQLCRQGAVILDGAERRVEILLGRPGGGVEAAPFEEGNGGGGANVDSEGRE